MPATTTKLPDHLRNRCLAPSPVKLQFSAVPKPVRMPKPALSADPGAPKRKRGGQPGNTNRLKHGRYSTFAMPAEPDPAPSGYLLPEQRIDFGPRRRGAQPGNTNRMLHGQRSLRSRAGRNRIKALIARGKALLDICNTLAAMAERYVAQREAAKAAAEAIKQADFSALHLPPFTGEVPREAGGRGQDRTPPHSTPRPLRPFGPLPPHAGEDEDAQPLEYLEHALPITVRIPNRPENRGFRRRHTCPSLSRRPAMLRYGTRHRAAFGAVTRARDAPYQRFSARTAQSLTLTWRLRAA